jgi:phosphoglycolate phosphatase-like HAD superfamily hydrolase
MPGDGVIEAVLFDIDGTLVATGGAGQRAFRAAFASLFDLRDGMESVAFAGRTDASIARGILARHGIEPTLERLRRFYDSYAFWLDHFLERSSGSTLPGVVSCIDRLARLRRPPALGLLTGNIRLGAELKLRHYNLWQHFLFGAFGDEHEERDELARLAHHRAAIHARRPLRGDEVLVVGDTPLDIQCARAIGAKVVAVASGNYSLEALAAHSPDWAVPDLLSVEVSAIWKQVG